MKTERPIDKIAYSIEEAAESICVSKSFMLQLIPRCGIRTVNLSLSEKRGMPRIRRCDLDTVINRLWAEQNGEVA